MTNIIAIIPARGGSKGLPRKNMIPLAGKPLINWSIDEANNSQYISKVFVTTEDEEIAGISISAGASIINRPKSLAGDKILTDQVLIHAINTLQKNELQENDIIVLLQPTSPLRTAQDIDQSIEAFLGNKDCQCLISVVEPEYTPAKAFVMGNDGYLSGLLSVDAPFSRRQDLPTTYFSNGSIYIFRTIDFKNAGRIPRKSILPFIMPRSRSIDIDTIDDLQAAEVGIKGSR